ncbi:hypothetical protein SBA2_80002 [Acidobacteriia bacterium SbA2]|nr:hypothetical protein SBA2_80002 [Acidobacteriia bacterium SbA2]
MLHYWQLFQSRPAEERLRNASRDTSLRVEGSAPQGLDMSSRGQRPRKRRPLASFPLSPPAGRGVPKAGCGVWFRGFHPRLLNFLPSGEHAPGVIDHPRCNRVQKILTRFPILLRFFAALRMTVSDGVAFQFRFSDFEFRCS